MRFKSLTDFAIRFPDQASCADYLAENRWPNGFVCPHCGSVRAWRLKCRIIWECRDCGRQTSVTAGTLMHRSKLSLQKWFLAAWLVATHSNGISACQLSTQLGVAYQTAWLLLQKFRRAMVAPDRTKLCGEVEMDETFIRFRIENEENLLPTKGRSKVGRALIIGAIEHVEYEVPVGPEGDTEMRLGLGRIRLVHAPDESAATLQKFCDENIEPGTVVWSDGLRSYTSLQNVTVDVRTREWMEAHVALPWIHRIFANFKRWALGTYHGLRMKHLQTYLNEYEFRFNRRHGRLNAFHRLLGLSIAFPPRPYEAVIGYKPKPRKKRISATAPPRKGLRKLPDLSLLLPRR